MKKEILLLLIITFITSLSINAQECPPSVVETAGIYDPQFNIGSIATTDPDDYPATINILDSTGTVTITYTKGTPFDNGIDNFVEYDNPIPEPWMGNEIDIDNFSVDFGLGAGECTYTNQVLPIEKFDSNFSNLSLFPNPIHKKEFLNIRIPSREKTSVDIYDITGKLVLRLQNISDSKIDISNLNQGMYFVKIISDTQATIRKLVVTD